MAYYLSSSWLIILLSVLLGLLIGWALWRRPWVKKYYGESEAISRVTREHTTTLRDKDAAIDRLDATLAERDAEITRLKADLSGKPAAALAATGPDTKISTPKIDTPDVDLPKADLPKADRPDVELPDADLSDAEGATTRVERATSRIAPLAGGAAAGAVAGRAAAHLDDDGTRRVTGRGELPKADLPKGDLPKGDLPKADLPKADLPKGTTPKIGTPSVDLDAKGHDLDLGADVGSIDVPGIEPKAAVSTDAPDTGPIRTIAAGAAGAVAGAAAKGSAAAKDLVSGAGSDDDLERIEGIGPRIASALSSAGISTFRQLADADVAALNSALENAGLRFAPSLPTWSRQARLLADGDEEGFQQLTDQLVAGRDVGRRS